MEAAAAAASRDAITDDDEGMPQLPFLTPLVLLLGSPFSLLLALSALTRQRRQS